MTIRSPICTVVGHVDHGKSSILDRIRSTDIVKKEAGKITQAIGASIIPLSLIQENCGDLLKTMKMDFTIPGLLFIDTPGHAAFTNLRKRGGNLADIAILVVDINEGIKPQTRESIEILKSYKTPFIIAANKIDLIHGWKRNNNSLLQNINSQDQKTIEQFEKKVYEIVGKLAEFGFNADRFDRVDDYTKQIAIIPTSAETGEGLPELLMVLAGMAQKYLENCLSCDVNGQAKGIVLEVKDEKGIGTSLDVILYDGNLKASDTIIIGGINAPIITKVRGLFEPTPLAEMRDKNSKFIPVKEVYAATGVKIAAPDIDDVAAGMPLVSSENIEKDKQEIQAQVNEVLAETDGKGIVIKADSLGSLEALVKILKEEDILVKKASIGNITKKDLADAAANYEINSFDCIVLGFNVKDISGICEERVSIITSEIIYDIIDKYKKWLEEEKKKKEAGELSTLVSPCKIEFIHGYTFRQSNPAVFGVEVLKGTLRSQTPIMTSLGKPLSTVKSIQADKESVEFAEKGKQVAISVPNITIGRQINEKDIFYSDIPEEDFKKFKKYKEYINEEQKLILKEVAKIKRELNPVWGI